MGFLMALVFFLWIAAVGVSCGFYIGLKIGRSIVNEFFPHGDQRAVGTVCVVITSLSGAITGGIIVISYLWPR